MPKSAKKSWLYPSQATIAGGFRTVLLYDFDALEEHRVFAAQSLDAQVKALDRRVASVAKNLRKEDRDAYYDHIYDEYVNTQEVLPRVQWYAQFLIVYAMFEHMLNELCRIVQRRSGFRLSLKDIEGKGITKARNYLVKVAGVESPFQTRAWQRVCLFNEIRNAIAHNSGEIEMQRGNPKHLSTRLSKESHMQLKTLVPDQEDAQIVLSPQFVREAIADCRKVLMDVCNYKLYQRNGRRQE